MESGVAMANDSWGPVSLPAANIAKKNIGFMNAGRPVGTSPDVPGHPLWSKCYWESLALRPPVLMDEMLKWAGANRVKKPHKKFTTKIRNQIQIHPDSPATGCSFWKVRIQITSFPILSRFWWPSTSAFHKTNIKVRSSSSQSNILNFYNPLNFEDGKGVWTRW